MLKWLQVADNVKIGKSWIGFRGNCSTNLFAFKPILTKRTNEIMI